jgi:hypothetical protein
LRLFFATACVVAGVTLWQIWRQLNRLRNHVLGFQGERFAAGLSAETVDRTAFQLRQKSRIELGK